MGGRRSLVLRGLGPGSPVMARVLPADGRACEEGRGKSAGWALETVTWEARLTKEQIHRDVRAVGRVPCVWVIASNSSRGRNMWLQLSPNEQLSTRVLNQPRKAMTTNAYVSSGKGHGTLSDIRPAGSKTRKSDQQDGRISAMSSNAPPLTQLARCLVPWLVLSPRRVPGAAAPSTRPIEPRPRGGAIQPPPVWQACLPWGKGSACCP